MKLLRLTIYNMASLEGMHVIDFEAEPLRSADLFSIVGETGSGKSTILDAICLALYGNAPRFYNATKISIYSDTKVNKDQVLSVEDTRNILSKGTKECFSEVEFLARDGFRYKAKWGCSIARTNYSRPFRSLFRFCTGDDGLIYEKAVEIKTEGGKAGERRNANNGALDNIIGLDYNQFTRTVMLAQNSFANFIKAEDKEKAVLLEKLTGTEFYTSVAKKIYEMYKDAEASFNELYNDVKSVECLVLPEEKLTELNLLMDSLNKASRQLDADFLRNKDWQKWYSDKDRLEKDLYDCKLFLAKAEDVAKSLQPLRDDLFVLDSVSGISNVYHSCAAIKKDIESLHNEINSVALALKSGMEKSAVLTKDVESKRSELTVARESYSRMEPLIVKAREEAVNLKNLKEGLGKLLKEEAELDVRCKALAKEKDSQANLLNQQQLVIDEADRFKESVSVHLEMIDSLGVIKENFSQLDSVIQQTKNDEKEIEKDEKRVGQLNKLSEMLSNDISSHTKIESEHKDALNKLQKEIDGIDISAVNATLSHLLEEHGVVMELQGLYQTIRQHRMLVADSESGIATLTKQIEGMKSEYDSLDKEIKNVDCALKALEDTYNLTASSGVQQLRATLVDGNPCPVCGSLHHPYSVSEEVLVESVLEPFINSIKAKRKEKEDLEQRLSNPDTGVMVCLNKANGRLASMREIMANTSAQLVGETARWNEIVVAYPQWGSYGDGSADFTDEISRYLELIKLKGQENRRISDDYNKKSKEINNLQKQYEKVAGELKQLTEKLHSVVTEEKELLGGLSQRKLTVSRNKSAAGDLLDMLGKRISLTHWRQMFDESGSVAVIDEIQAMSDKYKDSLRRREDAVLKQAQLKASLLQLDLQIGELTLSHEEKVKAVQKQREVVGSHETLYHSYLGSENPDDVETRLKKSVSELEALLGEKEKESRDVAEYVSGLKGKITSQEESLKIKNSDRERYESQISVFLDGLDKKISADQLDYYLGNKANWVEIRSKVKEADDEVKRCLGSVDARNEAIERHLKAELVTAVEEPPTMEELLEEVAQLEKRKLQLDEEKQATGSKLVTHNQSVERLRTCKDELDKRRSKYNNWKELNDILGNANGDKFRETAQCFTLQFLVAQANEQLRLLNRRYSLEQIPNSLGIRIIDHDRADEVRNISSLSGGETFLVSLALALGLSSLSSRNINMSNLFVDEGFGTLDSSSLNTVIDALSGLQSMQGKKVGVISHTQEMKERIRTQIRVVKLGSGGRSKIEI